MMFEIGDKVRMVGGVLPWSGEVVPSSDRVAVVVPHTECETQYYLGRWDIDTVIQWLDAPKGASVNERYCVTSHKRLELVS